MASAAKEIVVWKVAFYGRPKGWERLIMRDGFRHCSALGWAASGAWLEIDANLFRIEVRLLSHDAYVARLVELELMGATVLQAEARRKSGLRWSPTCAGVIAGLLGVKGALRPEGLYRGLLRENGDPAHVDPDGLGDSHAAR
jgi:hypothetical protein